MRRRFFAFTRCFPCLLADLPPASRLFHSLCVADACKSPSVLRPPLVGNGNLQLTVIVSKAELEEPGAEICFSAEGCLAAEAAIVFMLRRRLAQDRKL